MHIKSALTTANFKQVQQADKTAVSALNSSPEQSALPADTLDLDFGNSKVFNMSWGAPASKAGDSSPVDGAIYTAKDAGALAIFASGKTGDIKDELSSNVSNISWGAPAPQTGESSLMDRAIKAAQEAGVVVLFASGSADKPMANSSQVWGTA